MSWPDNRSRSGWPAMSRSSSGTTMAWRPNLSSAGDAGLGRSKPELIQPLSFVANERFVSEIGKHGAAPERERLGQELNGNARLPGVERTATLDCEALEGRDVELAVTDAQDVARELGHQTVRRAIWIEQLPQGGNVDLERIASRLGWFLAPQRVDQRSTGTIRPA